MSVGETGLSTALPGMLRLERLDNGLDVLLLENDDAPVVTVALTYRAGARDDPPGLAGLAHFLEHMMFKGSSRYEAGHIDWRTRLLGGSNNAFTGHDATTYYFSFGADAWREALDFEADRMDALLLAEEEIEGERSVILEEVAMYEAEPWDALERRVRARLYGAHPYGRPIAGTAAEVRAITSEDLRLMHQRCYRPDNALLVVAGALDPTAMDSIRASFSAVDGGSSRRVGSLDAEAPTSCTRLEIVQGRVARLLVALPVPAMQHTDFAALRLLCAVLGLGRSSRLNRRLVEELGLCLWVAVTVGESELGGTLHVATELTPEADPEQVEQIVLSELRDLRTRDLESVELARARRLLEADWVFMHERIEAQALMLSQAACLVGPDYPVQQLAAIAELPPEDLLEVACRYLDPERGSVIGWARVEAD